MRTLFTRFFKSFKGLKEFVRRHAIKFQFRIKAILRIRELPYIIAILFTMLGWTFSEISAILTKHPTIEYQFSNHINKKGQMYFSYTLTNLTRDKAFSGLLFQLELDTADYAYCQLDSGKIIAKSPAPRDGYQRINDKLKNHINFSLKRFYPQTQYKLIVYYSMMNTKDSEVRPFFSYTNDNSSELVILKEASIFTYLVKHDLWVYLILFIFLVILISMYFFSASLHENKTT